MTGIDNYVNALMENHSLTTESEGIAQDMMGGQKSTTVKPKVNLGVNESNVSQGPTGGFPPITLCEKGESKKALSEDEKQKREYSSHKTAVSIKDIMEKRRDITPFITL